MRGFAVGPHFTIFVLFFAGALIEALRHGDWLMAAVFVGLGVMFLRVKAPAPN
jgi:hypothetical protein